MDYDFDKYELILLWMAEGLLQQPKEDRNMEFEEIGEEYFNDLVSMSFFQRSNKSHFLMHDLINDLARSISGKFCFRFDNVESNEITRKTHHLSYYEAGFDMSKKSEIPYEAKGLRTFFEDWISFKCDEYNNIGKMIDDFLQAFKSLQVLSLSSCTNILELPVSVGNLKHLRHLNIQDTKIKHLLDSFCSFYNLQTLILSSYIIEFPGNMSKLINMRHLDNSDTEMKEMPPQMGKMKNLRRLPIYLFLLWANMGGLTLES